MRRFWMMSLMLAALIVAACDRPTGPNYDAGQAELEAIAYSHGLSTNPIDHVYTIEIDGVLYDMGCPLQCWLPEGIVTLVEEMLDAGSLHVLMTSPPSVYVPGTRTPILLQNARKVPQCANHLDDDADGYIDYPYDPGCTSYEDDDERNLPPIIVRYPPLITATPFVRGTVMHKETELWILRCPIRAVLISQDERTWQPLGVQIGMQYVRFHAGSGWVEEGEEMMTMLDRADIAGGILSAGWPRILGMPLHEARYTLLFRVIASDGEELMVYANDGDAVFCGI